MSKVANVIIAHKNPVQLERLVNRFDGKLFHNFIHIDGRQSLDAYAALAALPHVTLLKPRRKLNWAGYGFVQVTLEAMETILSLGDAYAYISIMSGQDYPIRPTEALYEHLMSARGTEFFDVLAVEPDWPVALHRYEGYHLIEWKIRGRYRLEKLINSAMGKRAFYNGKLRPYGRSAWFTATRGFAAYTLGYMNERPDFVKFLKTVWSPDEFLFNTLAMNSPFREKVADTNLRYIDWSEGKVNPKVFTAADLPALASTNSFLARKFDTAVDKTILDLLDKKIEKLG